MPKRFYCSPAQVSYLPCIYLTEDFQQLMFEVLVVDVKVVGSINVGF